MINAKKFRILLIDDSEDSNESTAELLRCFDYDARTASNGTEGIKLASEFQPHLILSDIGLPDIDGYELPILLQQAATQTRPIIAAMTGFGYPSDCARSRSAGFDAHFIKPIDAQSLLDFVAQQVVAYQTNAPT